VKPNLHKSAAIFCHKVAAWVLHTFGNFSAKNHEIANNSATAEARVEKITYLESLEFKKMM
jgi:hypothetical protein